MDEQGIWRELERVAEMMTNKKHRSLMLAMIYEYEKQICLQERMINKACKRLSTDVFCEELGKRRTTEEWKEALLRECQ